MRIRLAGLLLVSVIGIAGCKNPKKSGFFQGPISPTIAGDWNGSLQMAGATPNMAMILEQSNVNVRGTYAAPALSGAHIGEEGTVRGLSTGQSFQLTLTATTPGCVAKLDMNGFNSGADLSFNFTGVDCSCATVSSQGYGQRPG